LECLGLMKPIVKASEEGRKKERAGRVDKKKKKISGSPWGRCKAPEVGPLSSRGSEF